MAFTLLLVRHAEATHNAQGGYDMSTTYRANPALTARGRMQAQALARWLAGHYISCAAIYSSDQRRALQTSEPVSATLGVPVTPDYRLRDFGACRHDGTPYPFDAIPHRIGGIAIKDAPFASITDAPVGESYFDMMNRTGQFLALLIAKYTDGETVLVITHSGPMNTLPGLVLGQGVNIQAAIGVANGSLSIMHYNPDTIYEHWTIETLGNTQHMIDL